MHIKCKFLTDSMFFFPLFHKKCHEIHMKLNHSVNFFSFWEIAGGECLVPFINVKNLSQTYLFICVYYAFNVSNLCKHSACKLEKLFHTMHLSNNVIYLIKILFWELYQFFSLNWMRLHKSSIDWPLRVRKYITLSVCFVEKQWLLTWIHSWSFSYNTMEMFLILVSLWDCS